MGYTQPTAKTSGDPTLASDWNNYVRDNFIALRSLLPDPGASNLPLVSSSTSAAAFGQLGTAGIATGAITADRLGAGAVGSAALASGAVGSATLASGAVTSGALASGAVVAASIASGAVASAALATAAVVSSRIADNAVVRAKLAVVVQPLIGSVVAYAGTAVPSGWLLCWGQEISRTTYSALFNAISTTYGSGDGSTTFKLPDLQNRFILGTGSSYGLSAAGGATQHLHRVAATTTKTTGGPSSTKYVQRGTEDSPVAVHTHTHQVTVDFDTNSDNTSTLPPYMALNWVIYTGV